MENLKTLRGLLACIAILDSTSTNSVNAQCQDSHGCAQYRFPLVCEGKHKEWYLKNCPKSCKACPADQLSNMYVEKSTIILISSKSTIPEDRNVTDVNKVSMQPERTTGTTRILSSTGGAATCLDKAECSKYRRPLDCTRYPWFRQNCQASCNTCPGGTSKTTRTSTRKVSSPTRRTTPSKRVASVTVPVPPERTTVTTRILSSTGGTATCLDKAECSKHRIPLDCPQNSWFRQNCRASCNACPGGTSKTTRMSTEKVSSQTRRTTASKQDASVTVSSGACKDDKACTGFKDFHRLCSGTDGWFRQHCRLSCNMCITDQVFVTRDISHTSTTSPVRSTNISVEVYDDVTLAPSHPQRTLVTTWIPSPAVSSGACKDDNECTRHKNVHHRCSGIHGRWFREHCRLSCNMCIIDQVSVTRDISQTGTTSPLKARNVTVQVPDDVSQASGVCKDDSECTRYKDLHRLCSGTDGWFRQHCRLSCNMCITDQVSVTRVISHTSTTSPVKAMNVSVQEHDVVSQATSPAKSKNVSEQVHDDVSQDFPESASHLPSPYQNVIIAVVIIAVIILIVFVAGVVIFKKRRDKSSGKNPLQPTHKDMWSSDGHVDFTNVYEQTVLFSPDQRDQSSDQNHVIDINPPKQSTEETEVRDTCTVSVNKDGLVYSILDFKDFQPKDFVPPSPTERIEYATIDFGGTISCTKNTRD